MLAPWSIALISVFAGIPAIFLVAAIIFVLVRLPIGAYIRIWLYGEYVLTRVATIRGTANDVFDAVTTSRLWPHFYPETVQVGGVTDRPFRPGDMVIEKFMMMGNLYVVFDYTVTEYRRPNGIVFWTSVSYADDFLDLLFGPFMRRFIGEFTYNLTESRTARGTVSTKWIRQLRFHHLGGYCGLTALAFRFFTCLHIRSQMRSATMFVHSVKRAIESGTFPPQPTYPVFV